MQSLVIQHHNNLVTALQKVAEETSSNLTSMQRLIRKHSGRLEKFGPIEFEEIEVKGKTGLTKKKLYYLNEQQSYLFITFLKNTPAVVDFKERLIKEFFEMKKKLNEKPALKQPDPYIYQLERENIELKRTINRLTKNDSTNIKRIITKELDEMSYQLTTQFTQMLQNDIKMMKEALETSVIMMHKKITNSEREQKLLL